jgi:hypothetical protein
VTETSDDDDVLAGEADDRRELAHAIVDRARVTHRFAAEQVIVDDRDRARHARPTSSSRWNAGS